VIPGQTVAAANAVQISTGNGPFKLKINTFTWKRDGSEIAYLVEAGLKEFLPAFPAPGQRGRSLFTGDTTLVNGSLDWSPVRDEFLFYSALAAPRGIYRGDKGSDVKTHPLVLETDYVSGLSWLPDGSGFLYSTQNFGYSSNQIIKYDFDREQATVLVEGSIHLAGWSLPRMAVTFPLPIARMKVHRMICSARPSTAGNHGRLPATLFRGIGAPCRRPA